MKLLALTVERQQSKSNSWDEIAGVDGGWAVPGELPFPCFVLLDSAGGK